MWNDRCIKVFVLTFALIIRAGTLKPQLVDPLQKTKTARDRYWVLKTHRQIKTDMILSGDSRLYRCVSPKVMRKILPGRNILNFGYSGGGLNPVMYSEAEKRLDFSKDSKSIILAVSPTTLAPNTALNTFFLQEQNRHREDIYQRLYINPLLDFFKPITIHEIICALLGKEPVIDQRYYQEFHNDGWVASWTVPESHEKYMQHYRKILSDVEWQVSDDLVHSLMDQTSRWNQQKIHVYGFRPPTTKAMEALENELSGFDEQSFVKQFTKAGGNWFSFPLEKYHSYDSSHLHKGSAIRFSRDLAEAIKKHQLVSGYE